MVINPRKYNKGGGGVQTPPPRPCTTVGYELARTSEGYFLTDPSTVTGKNNLNSSV